MVRGLLSYFGRIIYSLVVTILFSYRLDKNVIADGFEFLDSGYVGYIGLLACSHHYNNHIVISFVQLMIEHVKRGSSLFDSTEDPKDGFEETLLNSSNVDKKESLLKAITRDVYGETDQENKLEKGKLKEEEEQEEESQIEIKTDVDVRNGLKLKRFRNKLYVAITLLNNPQLLPYRKSRLFHFE